MVRDRDIAPAIPFAFLHGPTGPIAAEITTVPSAINWIEAHFITTDFRFTNGGSRITVNRGGEGIYKVYVNAGVQKKTGNPTHCEFTVYVNGAAVPCCQGHSMIGAGSEHSDVALITSLQLRVNDYVEVYASVDAGVGELDANTARFIIEGLAMKGWDNDKAGKLRFRGEVAR